MHVFLVIFFFPLTNAFNLLENSYKIKDILKDYKQNTERFKRNHGITENVFVDNSVHFFKDTERFGEFLKYLDVSECPHGDYKNNTKYVKRHIHHGLLIEPRVPHTHWLEYKSVFNKSYVSHSHERAAQAAWLNNLQWVAQHNQMYLRGGHSYSLHLNPLGDWHPEEYVSKLLKLIKTIHLPDPSEDRRRSSYNFHKKSGTPTHWDWREQGYRPKLEEQLQCGACYAFAVTHALQAQLFRKHRKWGELSPQQIVDCSGVDGNKGCNGGSLKATFRYASREGLISELEYPYLGSKSHCHYNRGHVKVRPHHWAMLPVGDEWAIEKALAKIGPLAVGINAALRSFQLYRSGIYDDPFCTPFTVNHAMLLVGYTPDYWILLNWWGKRWGENGYMRLRRGFNRCGIANMVAYVEIL